MYFKAYNFFTTLVKLLFILYVQYTCVNVTGYCSS